MSPSAIMRIADPSAREACPEPAIYESLLQLDAARVLDVGCGTAQTTRAIATAHPTATVVGLEIDAIQHAANAGSARPANLTFRHGGAEAIPADDGAFDVVMLFKSLHHVPVQQLERAFAEIRRVLRPGGTAYLSEPVYGGELNDIVRIFHDEEAVRRAAFEATCRAVDSGAFELVAERFFLAPVAFRDFAEFEQRIIAVTHTAHRLDAAQLEEVRTRFLRHVGPDGARFLVPTRVDVLRAVT